MKAHETLIPLALFALAFAGALFVLRQPGAAAPDSVIPAAHSPEAARTVSAVRVASAAPPSIITPPDAEESAPPAPSVSADTQPPIEAVGDAIDTLEYSGNPDDRVRAIRTLGATARDGPEVPRVRSSLGVAAADEDPDVAARAQDEYDALVEHDDR